MNKYSLTEQQFSALRKRMSKRFTEENIEAAYAVMVKDKPVQQIADDMGKSRQHVYGVLRIILALHKASNVPEDWERVVVTLPPDQAKSVRQMEREALKQLGTDKGTNR